VVPEKWKGFMSHQPYIDPRYPLSALTAKALAAAHEVHRVLGPGFEEVKRLAN
jgi:hypothetical protein